MNAHEAHKVATEARLTKQAIEFHMLNKDIQSLHEKIEKAAQNGKFDIKVDFPAEKYQELTWGKILTEIISFFTAENYVVESSLDSCGIRISW